MRPPFRLEYGYGVSIGAGTFLNYDCLMLDVMPVTIGAGATIGAGSTITKNAAAGELTVARARQQTLDGWQRPLKQPK